ncbi:hypothetical protein PUMCH_001846 [Australozyma saopauloensis]|uniref:Mitochondrial peculiar membrane protein 1 n=1 Tax=Australozyma saopauloensis TaxID=291208 RepID=A0AAX4H9C0_9ASCO|nr:hypothetical protein PUMCH_001846 [[Candida] saopauloensis]
MCRFRKDKESEDQSLNSSYDEQIDNFFNKVNHVSDHLAEKTKRMMAHTREFTAAEKDNWSDMVNSMQKEVGTYFNKPYQTRTGSSGVDSAEPQLVRPFSFLDVFNDGGAETPYGLYSHSTPTAREYNKCMNNNGLSLWDSRGTWRCLFPNSAVPPKFLDYKQANLANQLLTKEDFERASSNVRADSSGAIDLGEKGIFFKQFDDLMRWKNIAFEAERQRREEAREERKQRFQRRFERKSPETNLNIASASELPRDDKPISWSSGSTTTTDPETNQIIMTEHKTEYFPDGLSVTNTVTKKKAIGASTWETVEEKSQRGDDKKGWFWS